LEPVHVGSNSEAVVHLVTCCTYVPWVAKRLRPSTGSGRTPSGTWITAVLFGPHFVVVLQIAAESAVRRAGQQSSDDLLSELPLSNRFRHHIGWPAPCSPSGGGQRAFNDSRRLYRRAAPTVRLVAQAVID